MVTAQSRSVLAWLLCVVCGCSVEASSNAEYGKSCAAGSTEYKGFCVDAGARDRTPSNLGSLDPANTGRVGLAVPPTQGAADAATTDNAPVDSQPPGGSDLGNPRDASVASIPPDIAGQQCSTDTAPCYLGPDGTEGRGPCHAGTRTCRDGRWQECIGQVTPQLELCNNADDDCDERVDEDTDVICTDGNAGCSATADGMFTCKGICRPGVKHCEHGVVQAECGHQVLPKKDEMCNAMIAVDDDCDGSTDETCMCKPGQSQQCYSGPADTKEVGVCKHGNQMCNNGTFGPCVGEVVPVAETCNMLDDDCDRSVDEGLLETDPNNCGQCGQHCGPAQSCCAGRCVDSLSDIANCGACGHACGAEELCCSGECVSKVSNDHCGSCTNICSSILICCPTGTCGILNTLGICL